MDTASGAIAKPINLSVTFERDTDGSYLRGTSIPAKAIRIATDWKLRLWRFEAGRVAVAFASGCSAITAVLRRLKPGDHVIIPDDVFQGKVRILREVLSEWQITYSAIDLSRMASVGPAFRPNTKLVWMETLSNPLLKVTQLKEVPILRIATVRSALWTTVSSHLYFSEQILRHGALSSVMSRSLTTSLRGRRFSD